MGFEATVKSMAAETVTMIGLVAVFTKAQNIGVPTVVSKAGVISWTALRPKFLKMGGVTGSLASEAIDVAMFEASFWVVF